MADFDGAARRMVQEQLRDRGISDERVLAAMQRVPRHRFTPGSISPGSVREADLAAAYSDHAMPIAEGQTISQPFVVAKMTELLEVAPGMKVLEIGTGSGYQAAVLAELGGQVTSIERYETLAQQARQVLTELGYAEQVTVVVGDGTLGWSEGGLYDRIIVTAGGPTIPQALRDQLADSGRLVMPVGDQAAQVMTLLDRHGSAFTEHTDFPCRFVPLVGEQGWGE